MLLLRRTVLLPLRQAPAALSLACLLAACAAPHHDTMIVTYVRKGDIAAVQSYIDRGGDVNAKFLFERNLLHHAVFTRHLSVVQLLLDAGADPDLRDRQGYTALNWTAVKGYADEARILVDAGADVYISDLTTGENALHKAAWYGNAEVLQILLSAGADVNSPTIEDETSSIDVSETPYDRYDVFFRSEAGRTPLHMAASWNRVGVADILMKAGAQIEVTTINGKTPLHTAAQFKSIDIIRLLLAAGANPNAVDESGKMPVDYAIEEQYQEVVDVLAEHND